VYATYSPNQVRSGPALLVGAVVATGLVIYLTTRKSRAATVPAPAPAPAPAPQPAPTPAPPAEQAPSTTAQIWFPLYETTSVPLYTSRELRGWFQGSQEAAAEVQGAFATTAAQKTVRLSEWTLEPGQVSRPDLSGTSPYIAYRTTTSYFPSLSTVRQEVGVVWTTSDRWRAISDELGPEWELRAWLGAL
jgi:hypothetical protein